MRGKLGKVIKVAPGMEVREWHPEPNIKVKPLNVEMARRHLNALKKFLADGDIKRSDFNRLKQQIIRRVVAQ